MLCGGLLLGSTIIHSFEVQESISRWSWQNLGWQFILCHWWFWSRSAWWILHLGIPWHNFQADEWPTFFLYFLDQTDLWGGSFFCVGHCYPSHPLTDFRWVHVCCFVVPERVHRAGRSPLIFLDTQFSIDAASILWGDSRYVRLTGSTVAILDAQIVRNCTDRLLQSFARISCRETLHSSLAAVAVAFTFCTETLCKRSCT